MKLRRSLFLVMVAWGVAGMTPAACPAQCCLSELFSCCRKAPAAVAIAPIAAPIVAPIPAPPPPVVVPVQQVSYVPETTYRTQYQCVPVTSYKPTTEIDPCTGCPRECMEQVTQYVQQPVSVPVTQYRAVYSTKYVQMQPGYASQGVPGLPATAAAPTMAPASGGTAASPFASTIQTTPQAWGAAGSDVPQQLIQPAQPQGVAAPAMAPPMMPQQGAQQPVYQSPVVPQGGTYATPSPATVQPQPTTPPALAPTPSLKPIPELQKAPSIPAPGSAAATQPSGAAGAVPSLPPSAQGRLPADNAPAPVRTAPGGEGPGSSTGRGTASEGGTSTSGSNGMPVLPGGGPTGSTGAFPKLLEPTGHTTSWRPAALHHPAEASRPSAYPTASLPGRVR